MRSQLTVSVAWLNQQQGLDLICSFGLLGMLSVPWPLPYSLKSANPKSYLVRPDLSSEEGRE